MHTNHRHRKPVIVAIALFILVFLSVLGTRFGLANKDLSLFPIQEIPDSPTGWGDDGIYEVGVEWMNVFPNPALNRNYWNVSCDGLYLHLQAAGWTPRYRWANYDAFEKDSKKWNLGGWENGYVDNVDAAMICTHGAHAYDSRYQKTLTAVYFGSQRDDQYLSPGEAYMAYGDKDLEYLAFDSCSVLEDTSVIYWASTFNGLHLLLGFSNPMHPDPYGDGWLWGFFMNHPDWPFQVTQAWFGAIDINQPSSTCARVIAENMSNYNEYWWNTWPDPVVDDEKFIWDHCSHGYVYGLNNNAQPQVIAMPIVRVLDRTVDENYIRQNIAPAFNMSGEISQSEMFYIMGDTSGGITRTLFIDSVTGSFAYHNLSKLWVTPSVPPALPSPTEAPAIVDGWIRNLPPELNLPGVGYRNAGYNYASEDIVGMLITDTLGNDLSGQETSRLPVDIAMTYHRLLQTSSNTTDGYQLVNYPVFGPGGRMVVYLGDSGEVIGAQGGSRDVQIMSDIVETLDPNSLWDQYLKDPSLAIGEMPVVADAITHTLPILGYYEMPYIQAQHDLIPVYEFRAYFYQDGVLVAGDVPVYLPAAQYYLPPQASILNPANESIFWSGEPISFKGSITGGTPPYTVQWLSSTEGVLGDTIDIVASLTSPIRQFTLYDDEVSFQVTDANGLTSTATITLKIRPLLWMPWITK